MKIEESVSRDHVSKEFLDPNYCILMVQSIAISAHNSKRQVVCM